MLPVPPRAASLPEAVLLLATQGAFRTARSLPRRALLSALRAASLDARCFSRCELLFAPRAASLDARCFSRRAASRDASCFPRCELLLSTRAAFRAASCFLRRELPTGKHDPTLSLRFGFIGPVSVAIEAFAPPTGPETREARLRAKSFAWQAAARRRERTASKGDISAAGGSQARRYSQPACFLRS